MRPAQCTRKPLNIRSLFYGKAQVIQNVTSHVMNLTAAILPGQFITSHVTDFREPLGVGLVEQSEIAQIGDGKPFPVPCEQFLREFRQHFFPICRTFLTNLHFLDYLTPSISLFTLGRRDLTLNSPENTRPHLFMRSGVSVGLCFIFPPFQGLPGNPAVSQSCHRVNNLLRSEVNLCRILRG